MIALMLTIELLSFSPASIRAASILRALAQTAPSSMKAKHTTTYRGQSDLLVLWGPGDPQRVAPMQAQLANGGHVLALDLAYWQRDLKFRVSIDSPHPQAWVLRRDFGPERLAQDLVTVRDVWNPTGPVMFAGIGSKARVQYGDTVSAWERQMIADVSARWPGRRLLYRRKRPDGAVPQGTEIASQQPIEEALAGTSLVVTWHSNVAVDAIRMGIPAICRDGAAAAVCASALGLADPAPLDAVVRQRFLRNLAWFQWAIWEGPQFWAWVPEVLA